MVSLNIDKDEIKCHVEGICMVVCAEELAIISYFRNRLAEQLGISAELANSMITKSLKDDLQAKE